MVHDYIHVVNLADGHTAALKKLSDHKIGCEVYNLGTGKGTSALEMVVAFEKASGKRNWMTSQSKGFHLRISRLFLFKKIRAFIKKPSIAVDDSIFKGPNQVLLPICIACLTLDSWWKQSPVFIKYLESFLTEKLRN